MPRTVPHRTHDEIVGPVGQPDQSELLPLPLPRPPPFPLPDRDLLRARLPPFPEPRLDVDDPPPELLREPRAELPRLELLELLREPLPLLRLLPELLRGMFIPSCA